LRSAGIHLKFLQAYRIMGKSQIAKYLPGNVFHFLGRVTLSKFEGLSVEPVAVTVGIETLIVALAASAIGVMGFSFGYIEFSLLGISIANIHNLYYGFVAVAIALLLTVLFMNKSSWISTKLGERAGYLKAGNLLIVLGLDVLVFMGIGTMITLLLNGFWAPRDVPEWIRFSCGYSLAWMLGFIVPGAPGGIGIREAIFVGIFGNELGQGTATGLALILRAVTSASDLVTFLIASIPKKTSSRGEPNPRIV
jgi:hypothetical protein